MIVASPHFFFDDGASTSPPSEAFAMSRDETRDLLRMVILDPDRQSTTRTNPLIALGHTSNRTNRESCLGNSLRVGTFENLFRGRVEDVLAGTFVSGSNQVLHFRHLSDLNCGAVYFPDKCETDNPVVFDHSSMIIRRFESIVKAGNIDSSIASSIRKLVSLFRSSGDFPDKIAITSDSSILLEIVRSKYNAVIDFHPEGEVVLIFEKDGYNHIYEFDAQDTKGIFETLLEAKRR